MKSQNLAIGFAIILQQTLQLTQSEAEANNRLYTIGSDMGIRMSDQLNPRQCSFLSTAQTIKALIPKLALNALGLTLELVQQNIKFEKRNHFYNLSYRQSGLPKSILAFCEDVEQKYKELEPGWIIAGFIYGVLRTMNFYGAVKINRGDGGTRTYLIEVKKDIKQED